MADKDQVKRQKENGIPETWVDSKGRKRQHTGMLQHEGKPNDEPPPESESPAPGRGLKAMVQHHQHEYIKPGETNPEPKAESDSPPPGQGMSQPAGPPMIIENPDSLIPEEPGLIERGD